MAKYFLIFSKFKNKIANNFQNLEIANNFWSLKTSRGNSDLNVMDPMVIILLITFLIF